MFKNKTFNFSSFLAKSSKENRPNSFTLQPIDHQKKQKQQKQHQALKIQNQNLREKVEHLLLQLSQVKSELKNLKELFIQTKIQHDQQIRVYDELLQQIKEQINEKDFLLTKYSISMRNSFQKYPIIQNNDEEQDSQQQNIQAQVKNLEKRNRKEDYQQQNLQLDLMNINKKPKYFEATHHEQTLTDNKDIRISIQRDKNSEKSQYDTRGNTQLLNGRSSYKNHFVSKNQQKIIQDIKCNAEQEFNYQSEKFQKLNYIDKQVDDVEFKFFRKEQKKNDEAQIQEERIQNLERYNFELQHQLASKSHKIARIFNAAFQFGGTQLLDFLQTSIGLVQKKTEEVG